MLYELFGRFDLILALQTASKVLLSIILGGLVGWERERRNMPAGIRTFILVSAGSCMFTILSYQGFIGGDPGRVAAQIVSGIGFLGAGVMIQRKGTIYGLTSAASIWAVAAVGMAVGTGSYFLATFGALAIFVILGVLRQLFKEQVAISTRRTLNTALRQVRGQITAMGRQAGQAIRDAIQAVADGDGDLARQVIEGDEQINRLRYQVEEACLEILRTHHPGQIQLRTVLAATHIVSNLERIGDYAKEIARIGLQMGREPPPMPLASITDMAGRVCDALQRVLVAFARDDVKLARQIHQQASAIDQTYQEVAETIADRVAEKKPRHLERGAHLLNIAYYLKRGGERVTNIAERIIFVRTGALEDLDRED